MLEYLGWIALQIGNMVNLLGYWGLGVGMFIESACGPIPSEVILPAAGMMVSSKSLTMFGANFVANFASMLGSVAAYLIGTKCGRPFILKHSGKFLVSKRHFEMADTAFSKYGMLAVLFGRLLPVIRTFISLPAGVCKVNFVKFLLYSLIGMIPWNFTLIYLGFKFGESYDSVIEPLYRKFEYVVIAVLISGTILSYALYRKKQSKKKLLS